MAYDNEWRRLLLKNRGGKAMQANQVIGTAYRSVTTGGDGVVDVTPIFNGPLNKLWRIAVLTNRATSLMAKSDKNIFPGPQPNPETKNTVITRDTNEAYRSIRAEKFSLTPPEGDPLKRNDKASRTPAGIDPKQKGENLKKFKSGKDVPIKNQIIIVNPSSLPITKVILQGLPIVVEFSSESSWATVKSIGRNNPYYIFTGSEDVISFDISWYAIDENREDVINKCRLLESWTKADGYNASAPILWLNWGNSGLFEDDTFILTSAPYKLSNFQNAHKSLSGYVDLKMLPNTATQSLTFKRVTAINRTHENIIPKAKIKTTTGII